MALAAEGAHGPEAGHDGIIRWSHVGRALVLQHKVKEALLVEWLGQACWQQEHKEQSQPPHGSVHGRPAEPRIQSSGLKTKVAVSQSCTVPPEGGPEHPPIA